MLDKLAAVGICVAAYIYCGIMWISFLDLFWFIPALLLLGMGLHRLPTRPPVTRREAVQEENAE